MKILDLVLVFSLAMLGGIQVLAWFWFPKSAKGQRQFGALAGVMFVVMFVSGIASALFPAENSRLLEIMTVSLVIVVPLFICSRIIMSRKNKQKRRR